MSGGSVVAANIDQHLGRLGWDRDRLEAEAGITMPSDAGKIVMQDLVAIADALGVRVSDLVREIDQ